MALILGVPKEVLDNENRVAIEPSVAKQLAKLQVEIIMQKGAGDKAYLPDNLFENVTFVETAQEVYSKAEVIVKVQPVTEEEIGFMREGQILISFMYAFKHPERVKALQEKKVTMLAMELVPRISRAQFMDALSSQATVAGYLCVLYGAELSSKFFPMLSTAAGTIRPSTVLILGAGVAGLQAIGTAKRLGAIVEAYDVRSATKEQVESLGGKFLSLPIKAEGEGGYARELTEEEKQQQKEMLDKHIAKADVIISTAAVPGRPAPKIISQEVVEKMKAGSVIVDLAAESGGNCALTQPGEKITHNNVIIYGPLNVPSQLPLHASEMYAKNILKLLELMIKEGALAPDWEDEILQGARLTFEGQITHEATRQQIEGA